jgi:hypothetical protein
MASREFLMAQASEAGKSQRPVADRTGRGVNDARARNKRQS